MIHSFSACIVWFILGNIMARNCVDIVLDGMVSIEYSQRSVIAHHFVNIIDFSLMRACHVKSVADIRSSRRQVISLVVRRSSIHMSAGWGV